jgi:hypothetical protein
MFAVRSLSGGKADVTRTVYFVSEGPGPDIGLSLNDGT